MSVPVAAFIPRLRVYFFNNGDQSNSIRAQMGRQLSAEHEGTDAQRGQSWMRGFGGDGKYMKEALS